MHSGYMLAIGKNKEGRRYRLRLSRERGTRRAVVGDHHSSGTGCEIRRRENVDLGRTDVVDESGFAVHAYTDAVEGSGHLAIHEVAAGPDARIAGGREVRPFHLHPGVGGD